MEWSVRSEPDCLRRRPMHRSVRSATAKRVRDLTTTVQPRLGIAYQIDPKTVIRAGGGEFATRMGLLDNIFPGGNPPFQPFVTVAAASGNLVGMMDNPGAALNPTVAPALTVTTLDKNLKSPIRWNWNLTIQRELPLNSYMSVAYVGGRGLHNWRVFDINQPAAGALQANPGKNVNLSSPLSRLRCDPAGAKQWRARV